MWPAPWGGSCTKRRGCTDARPEQGVTNRLAFYLAGIIVALIAADAILNDFGFSYVLARKFMDLLWWVAFWR